jgi:signal transduction histidine kinase
MRALIDDLMHAYAEDIYAPELALQPMSLEDLARSNTETNRVLAAQKQILLQLRSSGAIPPVLGDPARLEQVLDNLIHNAIKFSPRGSTIRVDVFSEATHAGIAVKDQGVGLDRIQLEALLTGSPLLHQVGTESEPGFGLGFAIIRAIVDKHGGTISGASVPGNGTTFSIRLPAQRAT